MHRIDDDDDLIVPPNNRRGWVGPAIGVVVFGTAAFWAFNHISNGCTDFADVFTYCSGKVGGVLITK